MADEEVSLRPMSLRPGGGAANPFAGFGKGAGFGIRVAKASATDEAPRKKTGEIVKYSKEFLLKFMERYTKCPIEIQQLQSEIVLTEDDPERAAVRQNLQRMAEDVDDKDNWRTRTPLPAAPQGGSNNNNNNRGPRAPATPAAELPKLQKAEELGRQAYRPGVLGAEGTDKAIKQVKGILNKLTPEKFDRLLEQLLAAVATAEVLQHAITMVFENAVAQPTFCALYAELCLRLSKQLPEFPPKEGEDKPMTFKRVLLNTCQDEFEAAAGAREELKSMGKGDGAREIAERKVKMRTLGNVRLISELYKKNVLNEKIMHVCIRDMLATPDAKGVPPEDNIEAVCEMITTAGKQLAAASGAAPAKGRQPVDALSGYLARLERIGSNSALPSRLKFLIRDVLDLKKNNWNPRRETFTAKKLDEVRAQAEAELGLIPSKLAAKLPVLPALQQAQQHDEMDLLPPLRNDDGWETVGKKGTAARPFAAGSSALLGDYKPPERVSAPAPAAPVAAAPAAPAAAVVKPSKPLTEEEFDSKCQSLYREYLSVRDVKEALTCVRELRAAPSAVAEGERGTRVASSGVDELLNAVKDADQEALVALLVALHKEGAVAGKDVEGAMREKVSALEDLSLDVPLAPKLLGKLLAAAVCANVVSLAALPAMLEGVESAEPKRAFMAAGLRAIKASRGEDALKKLADDAKLTVGELLKADELDGDLPSVADFLREQGLSCVPL